MTLSIQIEGIHVASESVPSESECRPYIEKALNTAKGTFRRNFSGQFDPEKALSSSSFIQSIEIENVGVETATQVDNSEETNDGNDAIVSDDNDVSDENR